MNSESEKSSFTIWIVVFLTIAIPINWFFLNHSFGNVSTVAPSTIRAIRQAQTVESQTPLPPPLTPAQIAANARADFLARYVNPGHEQKSGVVALVVNSKNANESRILTDALLKKFATRSVDIQPSYFKHAFITDGLFDKAFNDSATAMESIPVANALNGLILAREKIQFEKNGASLDNVLSAHIQLDIVAIPFTAGIANQTWSFVSNGAGFSQGEAQANAEERLQKQINENSTMKFIQ